MSDENKELEFKIREIVREEFFNLLKSEFKLEFEEEIKRLVNNYIEELKIERELQKNVKQKRLHDNEERKLLLSWFETVKNRLMLYIDSEFEDTVRPVIKLKDGNSMGLGFASHLSGDPGHFKKLGFSSYASFYSNPISLRNKFLESAMEYYEEVVPENLEDVKTIRLKEIQKKLLHKFNDLIKQLNLKKE